MKIAFISTAYSHGGAFVTANRIADAVGDDSQVDVLKVGMYPDDVAAYHREPSTLGRIPFVAKLWDRLPLLAYPNAIDLIRKLRISPSRMRTGAARFINSLNPDVVHLHWINGGFLCPEEIGLIRAPIVWTIHDMWPFTGGCHYSQGCGGFLVHCGSCPQMLSTWEFDLTRELWGRKSALFRGRSIQFVAPSTEHAALARQSSLLRDCVIHVIPNPVDGAIFRAGSKVLAREMLGLPQNKKVILFGGHHAVTNTAKGFDLLLEALAGIQEKPPDDNRLLVIFGSSDADISTFSASANLEIQSLGYLHGDKRVALAFQAADVLVQPSRHESFGNTVIEALACGLPVVAFSLGAARDLIRHGETGFLVDQFDTGMFGKRILEALDLEGGPLSQPPGMRPFDSQVVGRAYRAVYELARPNPANYGT